MNTPTKLMRRHELQARSGKARSTIYDDLARGLLTRPVRIGVRAVAWPEHEIEQILQARIRGADDPEVMRLVERLHTARQQVA